MGYWSGRGSLWHDDSQRWPIFYFAHCFADNLYRFRVINKTDTILPLLRSIHKRAGLSETALFHLLGNSQTTSPGWIFYQPEGRTWKILQTKNLAVFFRKDCPIKWNIMLWFQVWWIEWGYYMLQLKSYLRVCLYFVHVHVCSIANNTVKFKIR